jgi:MFS transporter, ACS family, hexuronate transporter
LSTGIFNAGSNVGIILAAYSTPLIVTKWNLGWAAAFYLTGALGFLWFVLWYFLYRRPEEHPRVNRAELDYIRSDPADPAVKIPWLSLLKYRQTWAFALGMFMTGPIWWFYLYWLPKFLLANYGIDLQTGVFWPLLIVYLMADVGSVAGGGLSSWLIRRGFSINASRKLAFLACALCVVPVVAASRVTGLWSAVLLVGVAASAHQGFSANLYTIVSDTVPRKAVSSVVGIGGTASCVGMILFSTMVGKILDWTQKTHGRKDYLVPFVIAGFAYLVATGLIHALVPRLEPMKFEDDGASAPPAQA